MPELLNHPPLDTLHAYAQGKLSAGASAVVEEHITVCTECSRLLRVLPPDGFVKLVRKAAPPAPPPPDPGRTVPRQPAVEPHHTTPPHGVREDTRGDTPPPPGTPVEGVPAQLIDHPRYQVLKLLGEGGMGAVYAAQHLKMDRKVALKVIHPHLLERESALPRFLQEVRAAAKLSHPNIVQAFDADEADGLHFLVMEYVKGIDLARYLEKKGALPVHLACYFARQAALGLQHAHEHDMVHRDIKPHNLMVTAKGQVKILDFGLARFARDTPGAPGAVAPAGHLTGTGVVMGTADYIAPEQTKNARAIDIRADIYSLGCTLYQLLCGRVPFAGGSAIEKMIKHAIDAPPPLRTLCPDLPNELYAIVDKMMAKDPDERYLTPAEVARVLSPYVTARPNASELPQSAVMPRPAARSTASGSAPPLALEPVSGSLPEVATERPRSKWRTPTLLAALGVLFAVLVAGGAVLTRGRTSEGEFALETVCDDVDVLVKQNGQVVTVVDVNRPTAKLREGRYQLVIEVGKDGRPRDDVSINVTEVEVKRGEKAVAVVRRVPKQGPPKADAPGASDAVAQAQAALDANDSKRAADLASQVLARDPNSVPALLVRAGAFAKSGQHDKAEADADAVIRQDAKNYRAWLLRGEARLKQTPPKLSAAIGDLTRAMQEGAGGPVPYSNRAYAKALAGDYPAALEDYDRLLKLLSADHPTRAEEQRIRGHLRLRVGDEAGAAADESEALKLNPAVKTRPRVARFAVDPQVAKLTCESESALRAGQHTKAVDLATQALKLYPKYSPALVARGRAHGQSGQWKDAEQDGESAIAWEPELAAGWLVRGLARGHLGRFKEAVADYDAALDRLSPADLSRAAELRTRGFLKERAGDAAAAKLDEQEAVKLDPKQSARPNPFVGKK